MMNFRKRYSGWLFFLLITCAQTVAAQGMANFPNRIDYVKENRLYVGPKGVTIVSLDLEWPVRLNQSSAVNLQKFLCQQLFHNKEQSLVGGFRLMTDSLGECTQTMPDVGNVNKKYITIMLRQLASEKDSYVSFRMMRAERNSQKAGADLVYNDMFTYDIQRDKVLHAPDLIRKKYYPYHDRHDELLDLMEQNMPLGGFVVDGDKLPDQACLLNRKVGMAFNLVGTGEDGNLDYLVILPRKDIGMLFTKASWQLIEPSQKKNKKQEKDVKENFTVPSNDDDLLLYKKGEYYDVAEVMPSFDGGMEKYRDMISAHLKYPDYEKILGIEGKVYVTFVVNKEGEVTSPSVIKSVSPGLDRSAVDALMAMPKWKPGMVDGQPQNVRMTFPVAFEISKEE